MDKIRKYGWGIAAAVGIFVLYFSTRIYQILRLPLFTDEAIYTRWSQIAKQDASWRFISLTDGKQPMFVWLDMVCMKFVHDPLLAGRLVSVFAGSLTIVGLFFLGKEMFKNWKIGLLSSFVYAVYPFALVYDRMAIYDSLVATFAVWSLFFGVLLVRKLRLDIALIFGLILGGGVLNKSIGFLVTDIMPLTLFLYDFRQKKAFNNLLKWVGLFLVAVFLENLYYSILRLSPFFHIIDEKDAVFVYPVSQWIHHPFTFFVGNLRGLFDWWISYMTIPVVLLVFGSFAFEKFRFIKEKLFLLAFFFAPLFLFALFGKTLYPRYVLFMTMPLLPLAAYSLYQIFSKVRHHVLAVLVCLVFLGLCIRSDYYIITDIKDAPIPKGDLQQYINDWPAGGGIREAVAFFSQRASEGKIYIATQGTFGLMPYGFEIYLVQNPNVTIKGFWPLRDTVPSEVLTAAKKEPTYFVFYQPCPDCVYPGAEPKQWSLKLIAQYKKGIGNTYLSIYQVGQ